MWLSIIFSHFNDFYEYLRNTNAFVIGNYSVSLMEFVIDIFTSYIVIVAVFPFDDD